MHKNIFLLLAVAGVCAAAAAAHDFESFKKTFGKSYSSQAHHDASKAQFEATKARIDAHNAEYAKGNVKNKLEINKFADIDQKTFHATHHGLNLNKKSSSSPREDHSSPSSSSLPASFDWRNSSKGNVVSPVQDQDPCGDCWAFSTIGGIESQVLLAGKPLVLLSEEQLVDCDENQGNGAGGCDGGGLMDKALQYLEQVGGAMSAASYPYSAGNPNSPGYNRTGTCKFDASNIAQTITGYQEVSMPTSISNLKAALIQNGPQSIAVDASMWDSQYSEGEVTCPLIASADHAVLLVGYDSSSLFDNYWIIKNQWGTQWGQQGYGKIPMGLWGFGDCGVTSFMSVNPTIT